MKPWRVSSEAVKNMLPAYNNTFLFIFSSEIRDVRYLPFNRSWNWGDSSDTQHLAAGILSTSSKTYLLWHFTWGQIFRLASIKTAVLYNVCKAKIQNINPNLGLGREHEGWFFWRLHLQQCVCVCVCARNDLNQAAMPASPGIPSLSTRALLARVQRWCHHSVPPLLPAPPPSHTTNFQSHFLVQLDWFILVLHFVPHIQLFHSPVLLVFYKNIHFSKAEKRERYILIYKRKKAKSDISLYS